MSSDELYQQRYNIQPNPFKGAQASVLSRFGKHAQTLGAAGGKGAAVGPETAAKAESTARLSKLALSLSKTQADAQGRLTRIGQEMERDSLQNQREITQAKIDQSNQTNPIDVVADSISLTHGLHGLARGIDTATGGEENTLVDQEKYDENYEFNIDRLMQVEGVESAEDLSDESLKEAHRIALASGQKKQGIGGKIAGAVATGMENIPLVGNPMKDLRKANVSAAHARRVTQSNILTKDMAEKHFGSISNFLNNQSTIYGTRFEVPMYLQNIMMSFGADLLEMFYSGIYGAEDLGQPIGPGYNGEPLGTPEEPELLGPGG